MPSLRSFAVFATLLAARLLCAAPQEPTPQKPTTLDPQASCTAKCHQPIAEGAFVHKPVTEGKCTGCHKQDDPTVHEFAAIEEGGEVCRSCHKIEHASVVHAPMESAECTFCHEPHHAPMKSLLRAPDEQTLCFVCHEKIKAAVGMKFQHGPAAEGFCTGCHKGHSSDQPKLLTFEPTELCGRCHTDITERVNAAESVHAPVSIDCTPCHDPHGSEREHLVKDAQPTLCFTCHKELAKAVADAKNPHGALTSEQQCLTCHRPHESKHKTLLREATGTVCASCHDKPQPRAGGGKPVAPISAEAAKYKRPHGPVQEGECTKCHNPHVSPNQNLLGKAFPAHFYEPYRSEAYELCFGCHTKKGFETPQADEETGFRDGDRNLHVLHVGNKDKGRTCRVCHQLHGGDTQKHIADSVPFGEWMLPIRWEQLPTGGRCAPGCHKPVEYSREAGGAKAHQPAPTPAPKATTGPAASGGPTGS